MAHSNDDAPPKRAEGSDQHEHDHGHGRESGADAHHGRAPEPHRHGRGGHTHDHGAASSILAAGAREGIRALQISAAGLLATAVFEFVVVVIGGSAALLGDALHNLGDVLTTGALWIAFIATRKAADHKYTFGYQRFEDLAGLFIVLAIFGSGGLAVYEGVSHLVRHITPTHLAAGMAAGTVGMLGNEIVAQVKIRAGRRIASEALVAEGHHSRVDGLASLGAVAGLAGVALGAWWADGVAGIVLGLVIFWVGWGTAKPVLAKVVDRIDPELIERIARVAAGVDEVCEVHGIRARWAGRGLYVLLHVALPEDDTLKTAHAVGEEVRHRILHDLPQVVQVDVHIDPFGLGLAAYHETTAHHFEGH